MKRLFIETNVFRKLLDNIGDLKLENQIKEMILRAPSQGQLIVGTGGLRKLRIAKGGFGKSGGYRVLYLDLPTHEVTYLILIYDKSVSDNINDLESRQLAKMVREIKNGYKSR